MSPGTEEGSLWAQGSKHVSSPARQAARKDGGGGRCTFQGPTVGPVSLEPLGFVKHKAWGCTWGQDSSSPGCIGRRKLHAWVPVLGPV